MPMTDEKTDLEQLLSSPGWLRFLEHARVSWKEQLPGRIQAAAELGTTEAEKGAAMLKVLTVANEVNALVSWPSERLKRLNTPQLQPTFSRGGYDAQTPR